MVNKSWRPDVPADLDAMIARYGWGITAVFDPAGIDPPFAYTTGLSKLDLPELIVFGLPGQAAHGLLNIIGRKLKGGEQLPLNTRLDDIADGFPAVLLAAAREHTDRYMYATSSRYPGYRALQLVWPDPQSRFPWEFGFDEHYRSAQPLLQHQRIEKPS